jgi:hypothetical protein
MHTPDKVDVNTSPSTLKVVFASIKMACAIFSALALEMFLIPGCGIDQL